MNQREHHFYEFGPFRLDATEGVLVRGGEHVRLTPKALKLLLVLVQNSGHIVDKDALMNEVWPNVVVEETNLAGNVYALRQALGDGKDQNHYIETIPKRGYRFVAKVQETKDERADSVAALPTSPGVGAEEELRKSESTKALVGANSTGAAEQRAKRRPLSKILVVGVTVAGLTVAGLYFWMSGRTKAPAPGVTVRSIAVLPLKNLSGDPEQEYFADGMTEALINELAKIGALRVISRTSVMLYKGARKTTPEIARELNVDAIVEGSVLRSNDRVRITAQLIRAATEEHLWAESYERDLRDVLALQGEIARGITDEIRIKLTPQEKVRLASARPINPSAHEAYLKGLYYLNQAINSTRADEQERLHKKSFEYFEQAIKFESGYALAYSGLARSYHWLASGRSPEFYPKAKESALKALALDDTLAEAHGSLAFIIWRHEWDFAGAEREFKKADGLAPNSGKMHGYAQFLSTLGRHDEAIHLIRLAQDLDPLTLPLKENVAWIYLNARQYDNAIAQFQSVLELDPHHVDAHSGLGFACVFKGAYDQGISEFQRALDLFRETPKSADLAWAYAMAGKRSQAIMILDDLKDPQKQKQIPHLRLGRIYSALGEKDLGMAQLEMAYAKRQEGLLWLKVDPSLDGLRSDPRFTDLMRRVGIPE